MAGKIAKKDLMSHVAKLAMEELKRRAEPLFRRAKTWCPPSGRRVFTQHLGEPGGGSSTVDVYVKAEEVIVGTARTRPLGIYIDFEHGKKAVFVSFADLIKRAEKELLLK